MSLGDVICSTFSLHQQIDLNLLAYSMYLDQTAPCEAVWAGSIHFAIEASQNTPEDNKAEYIDTEGLQKRLLWKCTNGVFKNHDLVQYN